MRPTLQTPWQEAWQPEFVGTLLFLVDRNRVLLIEKKTGHGMGKINAPGGKWDIGESLMACARREARRDGYRCATAGCAAELRFVERDGPQWLGYVFVAQQFSGAMTETSRPDRFGAMEGIPYHQMWADDAIWLPQVLEHGILGDKPDAPRWFMTFCLPAGCWSMAQSSVRFKFVDSCPSAGVVENNDAYWYFHSVSHRVSDPREGAFHGGACRGSAKQIWTFFVGDHHVTDHADTRTRLS